MEKEKEKIFKKYIEVVEESEDSSNLIDVNWRKFI